MACSACNGQKKQNNTNKISRFYYVNGIMREVELKNNGVINVDNGLAEKILEDTLNGKKIATIEQSTDENKILRISIK